MTTGTGFNASNTDHNIFTVLFCSSNGGDFQTGSAGGNFNASAIAYQNGPKTNGPIRCRIVQESTTTYAFWFEYGMFPGECQAELSGEPFTLVNTASGTAPTGTYLNVPVYDILTTENADRLGYATKPWVAGKVINGLPNPTITSTGRTSWTIARTSPPVGSNNGDWIITFSSAHPNGTNYAVLTNVMEGLGVSNAFVLSSTQVRILTKTIDNISFTNGFSDVSFAIQTSP
jgi:hypothetical protein